jgi:hypothetical protein
MPDLKEQGAVAAQRLSKLEHTTTLLQADIRDLRNGVSAQFRVQGEQLKAVVELVRSHGEQLKGQAEQLKGQGEQLKSVDAKLDAILSKLAA